MVVRRGAARPLDLSGRDDLWDPAPAWAQPDSATEGRAAVAVVQWRVVQAVLAARGRRHGAGTWLAGRVGAQPAQVNNKLKGTDWLQPHDLLVWAQALPELGLLRVLDGVEGLPAAWASLRREPPPGRVPPPVDNWAGAVAGLGAWLGALSAVALADEGALRLGLAEALVAQGTDPHRITATGDPVLPTVLEVRWASRLAVVALVDLWPAEHDPSRWPSALRRLHGELAAIAGRPADEAYVLAAAGPSVLAQLPWLPAPQQPTLPGVHEVVQDELERLDAIEGGPRKVHVVATAAGRGGSLLLCLPLPG